MTSQMYVIPLRYAGCFLLLMLMVISVGVSASPFVYTPTNPSFGGNPMNGNALLDNASAQNDYSEEEEEESLLESFNDRLQRSLLNRLTSTIAGQLIDEEGNLVPGRTETSDFIIDVVDGGDGTTTITTTDRFTGDATTFTVSSE